MIYMLIEDFVVGLDSNSFYGSRTMRTQKAIVPRACLPSKFLLDRCSSRIPLQPSLTVHQVQNGLRVTASRSLSHDRLMKLVSTTVFTLPNPGVEVIWSSAVWAAVRQGSIVRYQSTGRVAPNSSLNILPG